MNMMPDMMKPFMTQSLKIRVMLYSFARTLFWYIDIVTLRGCHQFLSSNDVLSVVGLVVCFVVRTARAMVRTPKPALRELQVSVRGSDKLVVV